MHLRPQPVQRYVAAVSTAGLALLVAAVAFVPRRGAGSGALALLLAAFAVAGELVPIRVRRRDEEEEITVSTTFVFALLLSAGAVPAMLALSVASAASDVWHRKPAWKAVFNVAQASLTVAAAAGVLALFGVGDGAGPVGLDAGSLPAVLLAGVTFFAVSNLVTGAAVALAEGVPVTAFLVRDLRFQAATSAVLLSLAPIVVAASAETMWLVPLLLLPIGAVHKAASILVDKEHEAAHDALTGLANRTLFHHRAAEALADAALTGRQAAVLLIDLDRFKEVNDTLGHHFGDLLLRQIGPRLAGGLRRDDVVARLGGDEFAVLLHDVSDEHTAMEVADRMLEAIEQPFPLPDVVLDIDASIGIALYPEHGDDVDGLLQRADVAMYLAKESRSGYQVYRADRDPYSPQRLTLLHDLRSGLEGGQLVLHYQPKADLASGRIVGVEALLRWEHPDHGLLPPDAFIPVAERSGLSRALTLYVLGQALAQVREWHDADLPVGVAVNLTLRNLHDPSFPIDVARLLDAHGVAPQWVQLEITESIVMADPTRALGVLGALRDIGVELALDDFGTGYSSLAHLKRLPVHELKIDKSFVMNMAFDDSDAVIVRSTIDLARNLRLRTVAEGVEDELSWNRLARLGCDVAQGYFLSRPKPAVELTPILRAGVGPAVAPAPRSHLPLARGQARATNR